MKGDVTDASDFHYGTGISFFVDLTTSSVKIFSLLHLSTFTTLCLKRGRQVLLASCLPVSEAWVKPTVWLLWFEAAKIILKRRLEKSLSQSQISIIIDSPEPIISHNLWQQDIEHLMKEDELDYVRWLALYYVWIPVPYFLCHVFIANIFNNWYAYLQFQVSLLNELDDVEGWSGKLARPSKLCLYSLARCGFAGQNGSR